MFQKFDGQTMYVVDITDFPPPMPIHTGGDAALTQYAEALDNAIKDGTIQDVGKYAIHVIPAANRYNIYKILE